jgi:hypothetical protein
MSQMIPSYKQTQEELRTPFYTLSTSFVVTSVARGLFFEEEHRLSCFDNKNLKCFIQRKPLDPLQGMERCRMDQRCSSIFRALLESPK